tara:strand:+ start:2414 stop:2704 length:291 start_codon:yes stop_codon:yes gene_type:complete
MEAEFFPLHNQNWSRQNVGKYSCIVVFLLFHIIILTVLVTSIASIAPEVQTTLKDVQVIMPEMRRTLLDLGQLIPEIKTGMNILKQLCQQDPACIV